MYSFEQFKKSRWTLIIISDGDIIFRSQAKAIKPLIRFLKNKPSNLSNVIIYDKYIGRAAAMLMTFLKPMKVYTPVISQFGREVFEKHNIDFEADKEVKYLMGIASEDMCKWEKLTAGKTPEELIQMLGIE